MLTHADAAYADVCCRMLMPPQVCMKQPSYGEEGSAATHCAQHRLPAQVPSVLLYYCFPTATLLLLYYCYFTTGTHCAQHRLPAQVPSVLLYYC
jgi:hypothetical protein